MWILFPIGFITVLILATIVAPRLYEKWRYHKYLKATKGDLILDPDKNYR